MAENLADVGSEPPGSSASVQLGFNDDSAAHDVQATGKPQCCGNLRLAVTGLGHLDSRQL
jgi:hypothetical protein